MEQFDVLVIGSGSGMLVASAAVEQGFKVALVEHGKMGGTCINVGCVPSKMLIYPADVVATIGDGQKLGVHASVSSIDFGTIMNRMHALVDEDTSHQTAGVQATPMLTWFKETGHFVSDYTMQVGNQTISAKIIFIVSGAHTTIPPIRGIESVGYLTSDSVLELQTQPKSIIIVGGGYIGVEYGHFFSSLGTKTTIIQRPNRLVPEEEPEVSDLLKVELSKHVEINLGYEAAEVKQEGNTITLVAKNRQDGTLKEFTAERLMIATGRSSNAGSLNLDNTGVKLDERSFVAVDDYLQTSKKNIYAFGDAIGKQMFKHVANYEAGIAWHNAVHDHKVEVNLFAAPHAVFTHPQIASVGLKEEEAKQQKFKIYVGRAQYRDTAMGAALGYPAGFVKVIVEAETGRILGAHIIGHEASILIQEIVNAMVSGKGDFGPIAQGMHVHPAICEVVQNAFGSLQPT